MWLDEGRNRFEEIFGKNSSDKNNIKGNIRVCWSRGYIVIAISKSLGYLKEAINEGMIVNANLGLER